ncbi:hypothetical protein GB931_07805 [Modestobacter sp. I12A-02628]|uniref:HEAT repeat domain-containing protein n=1 Tax=Goekera deserti TaxID=2497753 RepID=A0A7K3WHV3_9ACTN|nr:HEAT repeat domain-containing protein [Goekera deserti]MPQ97828.1 hypothetical protein [Goekera deserti]NDI48473.1 hypothetical protein [Goekera deserti]NEL56075.1 HEAT repeat domain-containing protein [Goekera deserti]
MNAVPGAAMVATTALAALVVLLLLAVAGEHARRNRQVARELARRARLTPLVHDLLDGEPIDGDDALDPLLDEMVLDLLPQLRGSDRDTLTALLLERGVVDRATEELGHRAAWRRGRAVTLLGNAASPRHTPLLAELLGDPVADVRCAAARALGKTGDPAAIGPLLSALVADRPVTAGVVGMAVLDIGTPALPELRRALGAPSTVVQQMAATVLGLHGDPLASHALTTTVADPAAVPELRCAAAEALGRIGMPSATATLCAVLDAGRRPALQRAAATALGRICDPAGLDALVVGLGSPDRDVRATCAEALTASGPAGRRRLAARDSGTDATPAPRPREAQAAR